MRDMDSLEETWPYMKPGNLLTVQRANGWERRYLITDVRPASEDDPVTLPAYIVSALPDPKEPAPTLVS
jgi:hypothetical protein